MRENQNNSYGQILEECFVMDVLKAYQIYEFNCHQGHIKMNGKNNKVSILISLIDIASHATFVASCPATLSLEKSPVEK